MRIALLLALLMVGLLFSPASAGFVLLEEDFESSVDQTGASASIFSPNSAIGSTTDPTFSSAGAGIWTRNGTRAWVVQADSNFTSATGQVAQLTSHTSGGFQLMSVPLIGGGNLNPAPLSTGALNTGDIIRLSFDLYVQAPTASTNGNFNWNTDSASGTQNTTWTEYQTASAGSVLQITKDLVITAGLTDITTIAPQIQFSRNAGHIAFGTNFAQLDNFRLEVITAVPEPSTMVMLGLVGIPVVYRRRRR